MTELKSYELQMMSLLNRAEEYDQQQKYEQAYDMLTSAERLIKQAKVHLHNKYRVSGTV